MLLQYKLTLSAHSHQAKARGKAKKIKEQVTEQTLKKMLTFASSEHSLSVLTNTFILGESGAVNMGSNVDLP